MRASFTPSRTNHSATAASVTILVLSALTSLQAGAASTASFRFEAEGAQLNGVELAPAKDAKPATADAPVAPVATKYSGSGYVTGFDAGADNVTWTLTPPKGAGFYRVTVGFRSPGGYKEFNGTLSSPGLGSIGLSGRVPASTEFMPVDVGLVELAAGVSTLRIGGGWGHYDIDYVELTPVAQPGRPAPVPGVPSDPKATATTRALFARLAGAYGRRTFSGQHEIADVAWVEQITGRSPAVLSGDLVEYSPTRREHGAKSEGYTESWIARHRQGHVVSLLWHWNAPDKLVLTQEQPWWTGFYTRGSTFDVATALADPAGADYAKILRDIDAIAVELKKLADADIPVLWRPLHEAEGGWFWWGARGSDNYKQLWRLLHERLTVHHGLHNLIWVLTSEDPAWYPGDDVVDVIGVDAYPEETTDLLSARWQALLARFDGRKLLALTEFGGVPDVPRMQRLGIWWAWVAPWSGPEGARKSSPETLRSVYSHKGFVSLDPAKPTLNRR